MGCSSSSTSLTHRRSLPPPCDSSVCAVDGPGAVANSGPCGDSGRCWWMSTATRLVQLQSYDVYNTYGIEPSSPHEAVVHRRNQLCEHFLPRIMRARNADPADIEKLTVEMARVNEMYCRVLKKKDNRAVYDHLCAMRKLYKSLPVQELGGLSAISRELTKLLSAMENLGFPLELLLELEHALTFSNEMVAFRKSALLQGLSYDQLETVIRGLELRNIPNHEKLVVEKNVLLVIGGRLFAERPELQSEAENCKTSVAKEGDCLGLRCLVPGRYGVTVWMNENGSCASTRCLALSLDAMESFPIDVFERLQQNASEVLKLSRTKALAER